MKTDRRFIRARRPEHKAERRKTILVAAGDLFEREGLTGLTLSALAREAQLTKSNLYTYFESVEHVMLTLALQDWAGFVATLEAELADVSRTRPGSEERPAAVAAGWTRALLRHPRFCSLLSVLTTVIQKNVSLDTLINFKRSTRGLVLRLVNALHAALPQLSVDALGELMPPLLGAVVGLWPFSTPGETIAELLAIPEFAEYAIDVPTELRRSAELLFRGALAVPKRE